MPTDLHGLRHVTATVGDARAILNLIVEPNGLRLVPQTVSYEDFLRYHLYHSNEGGNRATPLMFPAFPEGDRTMRTDQLRSLIVQRVNG